MAQYTIYPNGIDSSNQLPVSTDDVTPVKAEVVNRHREAIIAIESELGIQPSGTYTTVRARLDAVDALLATITGGLGALSQVLKDGSSVRSNVTEINFIGTSVTAIAAAEPGRVDVTITSGGGGTQTLAQTLVLGNTTGGNDIVFSSGDDIRLSGDGVAFSISYSAAATASTGGAISITSQQGNGANTGGAFSAFAGAGGGTGAGGIATLAGGAGGATSGAGGNARVSGGNATTSGAGGNALVSGGNGVGTVGGNVIIDSGSGTTKGTIGIGTTNASSITIGNVTDNAPVGFNGTGLVTFGGGITVTGTLTANGDTDIGNSSTDTISLIAQIDTAMVWKNGSFRSLGVAQAPDEVAGDGCSFYAGDGGNSIGTAAGGAGGSLFIYGGLGGNGSGGQTPGAGGNIYIEPGSGGSGGTGNSAGGLLTLLGGGAFGTGNGGDVVIEGGATVSGAVGRILIATQLYTNPGASEIIIGNTSQNPPTTFVGTGTISLTGTNQILSLIGSGAGTGGGILTMFEATNPTTAANTGALYTKDVSGTTQLFYRADNSGTVYQLTPAASSKPLRYVAVAGRQGTDVVSPGYTNIGAMVLDPTEIDGYLDGYYLFQAVLETTSASLPAEVLLYNITDGVEVPSFVSTPLTTTSVVATLLQRVLSIVTDIPAKQVLYQVRVRFASGSPGASDQVTCNLAQVRIS